VEAMLVPCFFAISGVNFGVWVLIQLFFGANFSYLFETLEEARVQKKKRVQNMTD